MPNPHTPRSAAAPLLNSAMRSPHSITGNSSITYQSGLADMNFVSGPTGGGWNADGWEEVE